MPARRKISGASRGRAAGRLPLSSTLARLERGLPPALRGYAKQVRQPLGRIERLIDRTQVDARRRAARLLRGASHQLGRLDRRGVPGWRRLGAPYRRTAQRWLQRLEVAVRPGGASPRKKAGRARRKAASRPARPERRGGAERRVGVDRRCGERRVQDIPVEHERRRGGDRRLAEQRSGSDRRH